MLGLDPRLRDEFTLIVDNRDKVEMGIGRNPGDKTSALEVAERLGVAAAKGQAGVEPRDIAWPQDVENKRELERTITKVVPFEMGISDREYLPQCRVVLGKPAHCVGSGVGLTKMQEMHLFEIIRAKEKLKSLPLRKLSLFSMINQD